MQRIDYPKRDEWDRILKRPTQTVADIEETVEDIFKEVQSIRDEAVRAYTKKFDKVELKSFLVSKQEIDEAVNRVPERLKEAITLAKENIEKFHAAQKTSVVTVETMPGVRCWQEKRPIQKVGLYIPGGTAPLFSTILMLAVPAKIAGCDEIVLCTPPNEQGEINPAILFTASLCGLSQIIKVGGIQAIAAMTFGTESIPKVYKIFGPGNQFVTVAKQMATKYGVAIDMPAGPSELLVVADDSANPSFVASDLLSQAEHGADSQVILVSKSDKLLQLVASELDEQLQRLSRKSIAEKAIAHSKFILMENDEEAMGLINKYGPEHFIVCVENEAYYIENIINAGSVFVGNYTPESAGDYASGTNHTLPTNGFSKQYSGVNLDSFTKSMTFQEITKEGIVSLGNTVEEMAEAEGLQAHKNAITVRLKSLKNN